MLDRMCSLLLVPFLMGGRLTLNFRLQSSSILPVSQRLNAMAAIASMFEFLKLDFHSSSNHTVALEAVP